MIVAEDVMDLMLAACPSFAATWDPTEHWDDGEGKRLLYIEAADFCDHLHDLLVAGRTEELPASFALIERLHVEGDAWVLNLATIGFLESLQIYEGFESWLQPATARWWDRLNRSWLGESGALSETDESRARPETD